MSGKGTPASESARDLDVSERLLASLEDDAPSPAPGLSRRVLARVRGALALRDLLDGLVVAPFRAFVVALRSDSEPERDREDSSEPRS